MMDKILNTINHNLNLTCGVFRFKNSLTLDYFDNEIKQEQARANEIKRDLEDMI